MKKKIRILLTSCGGLVIPGMDDCLRAEKDFDFHITGVDMESRAIGAHFVNKFQKVPGGLEPHYTETILEIAKRERIEVIVPLSDEETLTLSRHHREFAGEGIALLCSDAKAVEISSDKGKMLTFLRKKGIRVPDFYLPASLKELDEAVELLGYPGHDLVLKPLRGRGGRGFRRLTEKVNGQEIALKDRYLQRIPYPALRSLLAEKPDLPDLLVMQYLDGRDFNVDALALKGETLYSIPVERLVPEAGPVQVGRTVHDSHVDKMVRQIVAAFGFSYNINIEMAYPGKTEKHGPLVYEINPRVSAPIAMHRAAGVNLLLLGILLALGENIPENLPYKEITMQRYWNEVYT